MSSPISVVTFATSVTVTAEGPSDLPLRSSWIEQRTHDATPGDCLNEAETACPVHPELPARAPSHVHGER